MATNSQPKPTETPELLTPAQFGQLIGASRATVYRCIEQGAIKAVQVPNLTGNGTRTRITRDELARFNAAMTPSEVAS